MSKVRKVRKLSNGSEMSNKTAREILKDLLYKTPCGEEYDNLTIDKCLSDLKELLESKMPKKELHTHDSIPTYTSAAHEGCIICIENRTIEKVNQVIEEILK